MELAVVVLCVERECVVLVERHDLAGVLPHQCVRRIPGSVRDPGEQSREVVGAPDEAALVRLLGVLRGVGHRVAEVGVDHPEVRTQRRQQPRGVVGDVPLDGVVGGPAGVVVLHTDNRTWSRGWAALKARPPQGPERLS